MASLKHIVKKAFVPTTILLMAGAAIYNDFRQANIRASRDYNDIVARLGIFYHSMENKRDFFRGQIQKYPSEMDIPISIAFGYFKADNQMRVFEVLFPEITPDSLSRLRDSLISADSARKGGAK